MSTARAALKISGAQRGLSEDDASPALCLRARVESHVSCAGARRVNAFHAPPKTAPRDQSDLC
jgi:hypothetical protein